MRLIKNKDLQIEKLWNYIKDLQNQNKTLLEMIKEFKLKASTI